MNKKYALIFAILLTGLIYSNVVIFNSIFSRAETREQVIISTITDGDTLKLSDGRIIRLVNINSPEKGMPGADLAKNFLKNFENKTVDIEIIGTDKYQRQLARIYSPDYINLKIVERGMASKFLVQESELSKFAEAEDNAINSNLGIWEKSKFIDCITSKIKKVEEKVILTKNCEEVSIRNWMIKDESRKTYYFSDLSFETITLHSGFGKDNSTDIFWNNSGNIWNNDRDSLYIFDSEGGIVNHEIYGY